MRNRIVIGLAAVAMAASTLFAGAAYSARPVEPGFVASWTAAVELGLIDGDPAYYYTGKASTQEFYHALMTAILEVENRRATGDTPSSTTTTVPPTTSSSTTTTTPTQSTTTTSPMSSTTSTFPPTTTTVPPTTTTTTAPPATTTTTSPPTTTTTTPPPSGDVEVIAAGVHLGFTRTVVEGRSYLCEDGAVLDGGGVTEYAFKGSADGVTIDGCEIRNYDNPSQKGAIQGDFWANDWTITDNEVHHNWGVGIQVKGDRAYIARNNVHHQHQLGVAAEGEGIVFEDNVVAFNNYEVDYAWGWEAGGSKFWGTDGLVVRGNHFHDNHGPGIWADHDNIRGLIEGNLVEDNYAAGVFWEISYSAVIRDNVIRRNGFGHDAWLWGAGILVATSSDVEVYGNVVEGNYNGISVTQQARGGSGEFGEPDFALWRSYDNVVRDNVVSGGASGVVQDDGDMTVFERNEFFGNSYDSGHQFAWDNRWGNASWWRGFHPGDAV